VIVLWILIAGWQLPAVVLAPPLFVSALEWLGRGGLVAGDGLRRWALLVAAGLAGSIATRLIAVKLDRGGRRGLRDARADVAADHPHPPALAIALIRRSSVHPSRGTTRRRSPPAPQPCTSASSPPTA